MLSRLLSLSLSLVLLVCIWTGATELESTLTVDLEDEEARNKALERSPVVCSVKFLLPDGYNSISHPCNETSGSNCTVLTNGSDTPLNVIFEKESSQNITFDITFDTSRDVGCSRYIPNMSSDNRKPIDCSLVYSCNVSMNPTPPPHVESIRLWRFVNVDTLRDFINSSDKSSFVDDHEKATTSGDDMVLEYPFNGQYYEVAGYYFVTFSVADGEEYINQEFTLYVNPDFEKSSEDLTVILGPDGASNFSKVFCRFTSFPPAEVEWDPPSTSRNRFTTRDDGTALALGGTVSNLTRDGRLVFEDLRFDDDGTYTCTAVHIISGKKASDTLRLRVWSHLRPLWPSIGIVASFIITFLFICGGTLLNKIRGSHDTDDEGAFQRNYSVVSNIGEEAGEKKRTRKHQAAGKRTSITQQELLANASYPN